MTEIFINKAGSYQNLKVLETLFGGVELKSVRIEMIYDNENGLPCEDDRENWPFYASIVDANGENYIVHIYTLTVGYGGTGPHDFENILKFFNVQYSEDEIFTKRNLGYDGFIRLEFSR